MKRLLLYFPICFLAACTAEKVGTPDPVVIGQEIGFTAQVARDAFSRGGEDLVPLQEGIEITVIAPGYGTGAPDQVAHYKPNTPTVQKTELEPLDAVDDIIKRSARNMVYTAWAAPEGVDMTAGTVDFAENLEWFIGAHEVEPETQSNNICLGFSHLVAKLSVTVYDVTDPEDVKFVGSATITFPAIKQVGSVKATIAAQPKVSPGKSGDALSVALDGADATVIYIPPLTPDELTMYGSFTVTVSGTNYVGSLANLNLASKSIAAGDHIITRIEINDDHTAVLQAITLAPWTDYERNTYNRPSPGIWGVVDFAMLTQLVNNPALGEVDGYTLADFYIEEDDNEKVVILYTDLDMGSGRFVEPLGTDEHPFTMTFDGNGYTIRGIDYEGGNNVGVFGVADNATIKNLSLANCRFEGGGNVGSVFGKATGSTVADYCLVSGGSVSGGANIGGFAGQIGEGVTIRNAYVSLGAVSGTSQVGGFVGDNLGTIGNSCVMLSSGISCSNQNAGGFVGKNTGTIENAFSQATFVITPSNGNCGAWVGYNDGTNKLCYWNNTCIDNGYCTHIVGNNTVFNETTKAEILPSGTSGAKYNSSTGRMINANNDDYSSLRQQLNTNITSQPGWKDKYLPWAKVKDLSLPVFSY